MPGSYIRPQEVQQPCGVTLTDSLPLSPGQLPSHPVTPSSKHSDSKPVPLAPTYHTLPHPSHHGTPHTTINWGPLEPPKTPKPWSLSCLRPAPPLRPSAALCYKEVRPPLAPTYAGIPAGLCCFMR